MEVAAVDPLIVKTAEEIVCAYFKVARIGVSRFEDLGGSTRSRVYRFIAVRDQRAFSFVLKAPLEREGEQWTDRAGRLGNEVAALSFLNQRLPSSSRSIVPVLAGVNLERGILVQEEISPIRGRLDRILEGSSKVPGGISRALMNMARSLATIHAASSSQQAKQAYEECRLRTKLPSKPAPNAASNVSAMMGCFARFVPKLADLMMVQGEGPVEETPFFKQMEKAFCESFRSDGPMSALIHADLCPDNVMVLNKKADVCILDFEFSRMGNAAMDISFLRLGFPTCCCVGRLGRSVLRGAEQLYRQTAFEQGMEEVKKKDVWRKAMAESCALWTWGFIRSSLEKGVAEKDLIMSKKMECSPTRRQMIVYRLQVAAKALKKHPEMQEVYQITEKASELFKQMWNIDVDKIKIWTE